MLACFDTAQPECFSCFAGAWQLRFALAQVTLGIQHVVMESGRGNFVLSHGDRDSEQASARR